MQRIINEGQTFVRREISDDDALVELEEAEDEDTFADDDTSSIGASEDCEALADVELPPGVPPPLQPVSVSARARTAPVYAVVLVTRLMVSPCGQRVFEWIWAVPWPWPVRTPVGMKRGV
mgnify:CR=1 FL=1